MPSTVPTNVTIVGQPGSAATKPARTTNMQRYIGFRENRYGPPVTRPGFSTRSIPIRHDAPIASWATNMATVPASIVANPTTASGPRHEAGASDPSAAYPDGV